MAYARVLMQVGQKKRLHDQEKNLSYLDGI